jgi:hypothetical protein
MSSPPTALRRAARDAFDDCQRLFNASTNYWRLGNTFDTLIDYALYDPSVAGELGAKAQQKYTAMGDASWFDDYGWWGIAAAKAYSTRVLPSPEWYSGLRDHCWNRMRPGAQVWALADKTLFRDYAPRFDGGVWNSFWKPTAGAPEWANQCPPCTPGYDLCGIQNTVTNGLFLILCARVSAAGGPAEAWNDAQREYRFLQDWFGFSDPQARLLKTVPNGVLVRERVGSFANGTTKCGFVPDFAWAGDQGLILGGLVDLMSRWQAHPAGYGPALNLAKQILSGVKTGGLFRPDGTLLPWTGGDAPGGDNCDYLTGIGVFLRYLLYALRNNADLKPVIVREYRDLVLENAMLTPYDDAGCTKDSHTDHKMTVATNRLASLVAALELSKG